MLHTNTIEKHTLELLKTISKDSVFNDFFLVGGTALALHVGHRKSIDLDFFSINDADILPDCEMLIDVKWSDIKLDIVQKVKPLIK